MNREKAFEKIDKLNFEIVKKISNKIFEGFNSSIGHSHAYLLMYINNEGSCMVSDISKHLGITLSAVTNLIDRLIEQGLVTRERSNSDRRVVFIHLTDTGKEITNRLNKNRMEIMNKLFSDVTKEEFETFLKIYEKLASKAREIY